MLKKIFCVLISLLMLASVLVGCAGTDEGNETDSATVDTGAQKEELDPKLEAENFGGTFTILAREAEGYSCPYYEVGGNGTSSQLDSGIFKRNMAIQNKYNIQLLSRNEVSAKLLTTATTDALSGVDYEYDAYLVPTIVGFQMAVNDLLTEFSDVPYVNTDKAYYDQSLLQDTSIGFKRYFAHGHFSLGTYIATSALYLNKTMLSEYKLENPYELVESGAWTWEKMFTMCKAVTEIEENGQTDVGQYQYGIAIGVYAWQPLFFSTGSYLVAKDANDMPYLNMNNCMDVIQDINRVMNDPATTWFPSSVNVTAQYNAMAVFQDGRSLFMSDPLYCVPEYYLNSGVDYGILPLPKYTEDQQSYYSQTHAAHSTVIAVPKVTSDLNKTGKILEDFAYQSSINVYPVIMDVMIKHRNAQTVDDYNMLEIIFSGVRCDLGLSLKGEMNIDDDVRTLIRQNFSGIASTLAGRMPTYQATLDSLVTTWTNQ